MSTPKQRNEAMVTLSLQGYFLVEAIKKSPTTYRLTRIVGRRSVSILLEDTGEGFWIKPPSYTFNSKCSFFEFCEDEIRWTRNKQTIEQTVKFLKKSPVWKMIENKNFFKVNENNKRKGAAKKAERLLDKILIS